MSRWLKPPNEANWWVTVDAVHLQYNSDMNGRFSAIATGFSKETHTNPSQANSLKWRRSEKQAVGWPSSSRSWEYNEAVLSTGKRWFYGALDHCSLLLYSALLYTHSTIEQIAQKCRMTTKKTGNASKYALSKEIFSSLKLQTSRGGTPHAMQCKKPKSIYGFSFSKPLDSFFESSKMFQSLARQQVC